MVESIWVDYHTTTLNRDSQQLNQVPIWLYNPSRKDSLAGVPIDARIMTRFRTQCSLAHFKNETRTTTRTPRNLVV